MTFRLVRAFSFLAVAVMPTPCAAQVRASELGTVSQTVDGTVITLEYYRPRLRGRDTIFGGEVHWQEVWTPGANWATTLEVSKDIQVDGHAVPKGKYSMWMTVQPSDEWELLLDPRVRKFHTDRPDTVEGQIRFPVRVRRQAPVEVLSWSFPAVTASGATLSLQWSDVRVDLDLAVPRTYDIALPETRAKPYLGTYSFEWTGPQPWDSAGTRTITFLYRNGSLVGIYAPALWPGADEMILLPIAEQWYIPAFLEKGEVYDVNKDIVFEFTLDGGRVTGYEVRETSDKVFAKGEKQK
jgi:hypothetical protein